MDDSKNNDELRQLGLKTIDKVYGPGFSSQIEPAAGAPFVAETIDHLFANIWNRPELSVRDRRLLVLGATAMLGKPELVEAQASGALQNKELTEAQLEEAVLQLAYYVGWGNSTATWQGVQAAKAKAKAE
jgi:4-carboxymuconolactone decarboxylase